jgi:hypothetical protein
VNSNSLFIDHPVMERVTASLNKPLVPYTKIISLFSLFYGKRGEEWTLWFVFNSFRLPLVIQWPVSVSRNYRSVAQFMRCGKTEMKS